jgi:protein farnesyltransferase/geranylgeranyltransferase type-1 subunit alpha
MHSRDTGFPLADKRATWEAEASYAESLIASDLRNNSAWAHRFFVCFESGLYEGSELAEVVEREKEFALDRLRLVSANASAWNYLRGCVVSFLVASLTQT